MSRPRRLIVVLALVAVAAPVLAQAPRKDDAIQAEQRKLRQTEQQLRDEKRKAAEARARETSLLAELDQVEQQMVDKHKQIAKLDTRIARTLTEVTGLRGEVQGLAAATGEPGTGPQPPAAGHVQDACPGRGAAPPAIR